MHSGSNPLTSLHNSSERCLSTERDWNYSLFVPAVDGRAASAPQVTHRAPFTFGPRKSRSRPSPNRFWSLWLHPRIQKFRTSGLLQSKLQTRFFFFFLEGRKEEPEKKNPNADLSSVNAPLTQWLSRGGVKFLGFPVKTWQPIRCHVWQPITIIWKSGIYVIYLILILDD